MSSEDIIKFLKDHSSILVRKPVNGCIKTIHQLFVSNNKGKRSTMSLQLFQSELKRIVQLDRFSIVYKDASNIDFINPLNLALVLEFKQNGSASKAQKQQQKPPPGGIGSMESSLTLANLHDLLSPTAKPQNTLDYSNLKDIFNYETTCHTLSKFKNAHTTPMVPFIETCDDQTHAEILAKQQHQQHVRVPKDLQNCLRLKIHYIPMIKQHTDASLGDCSYLDTCHKLDSCRYVHYLKHIPRQQAQVEISKADEFNSKIPYFEKVSGWSRNGCVSNISRTVLESQWINCDVRKFNFNILGKFAAVIADPPWNIHMNLPYGTCNDNELLNLPLDNIQEEGIILLWVTGRAIEIGKESLTRWGYTIKNELIWIKSNQLSRTICTGRTGHWLNHSKEHLIIGVKGDPEWLDKLIDVDYIVSQTRETSRKPDELYGIVERLVGPHARKLEIFGRDHNIRPGWFTIGNQLTGSNVVEVDVVERFKKLM